MTRLALFATASMACAALVLAPFVKSSPIFVWNASPSAPMGLYVIEKRQPGRSEVAVLRPPKWASTMADQRDYLPATVLLLKTVVGRSDDIVCRFGRYVFVNGELRSTALSKDKMKRSLPSWRGCLKLRSGEIFVLSKRKDSFDSRYFGVIEKRQVVGTGRLILSTR